MLDLETAGGEVEPADGRGVHDRKSAVDVLQMEGLQQVRAVEPEAHFRLWRAADPETRRDVIGCQTGQSSDRTEKVIADLWEHLELRGG